MHAHRVWVENAIRLNPLRVLMPLVLKNLTIDGMYEVTAEFFTEVLTNFPGFLTPDNNALLSAILSSTSAQGYITSLKDGNFDIDSMTFARLLFAYSEALVQDIAEKHENSNFRQILNQLVELMACDAYAGAEDEVCSLCLEFWTTFTEFLVDSSFASGEEVPLWMESAKRYIPEVIKACWVKIRMPAQEIFAKWGSTERDEFKEFRSDVKDLLQSSYSLLGVSIFDEFAHIALESLDNSAWFHLEATLFCLNSLSDCVSDSISDQNLVDGTLSKLFKSTLFDSMMDSDAVPTATRQMAVNLINNFTAFFERHPECLALVLNFLFESLKTPTLANVAAKAVHSSCWACRKQLTSEINAFLHQYGLLVAWERVENATKEKIIGAIAAIIQALSSDEERINPLNTLLQFIERDVQACVYAMEKNQSEQAQTYGTCALRCLVSIGRAFQLPDDAVLDLDTNVTQSSFWARGEGASTQTQIIRLIDIVTTLMRTDSDVIEATCQILRAGYKESAPGPFVFPPSITEEFVRASQLSTPRLDYILHTAGTLLSRHATSPVPGVNSAALTFLVHILNLIDAMGGK